MAAQQSRTLLILVSLLTLTAVSAAGAQERAGKLKRGITAFVVEEGAVSRRVLFDAIRSADNRERVVVYETELGQRIYLATAGKRDRASFLSLNGVVDKLGIRGDADIRRTGLNLRTTDSIAISIMKQYEQYSSYVVKSGGINEPEYNYVDVVFYLRHPPVDGIGRYISTDICIVTAQNKSRRRLAALRDELDDGLPAPYFNDFRFFVDTVETHGVTTQAITALAAHLGWLQPDGPPRMVSLFDPNCPDQARTIQLSAKPDNTACQNRRLPYGALPPGTSGTALAHSCRQIAQAGRAPPTKPGQQHSGPLPTQPSTPTNPTSPHTTPVPKAQTPPPPQRQAPQARKPDPPKQTPPPRLQVQTQPPTANRTPVPPGRRPVHPPADSGATPQPFNVRIARFGEDSDYRGYRLRVTERNGPVSAALVHLGPDAGGRKPNRDDLSTNGPEVRFTPSQRVLPGRHRIYLVLDPNPSTCTPGATARVSLAQEGLRFGDDNPSALHVYRQIGDCEDLAAELIFQFEEP